MSTFAAQKQIGVDERKSTTIEIFAPLQCLSFESQTVNTVYANNPLVGLNP